MINHNDSIIGPILFNCRDFAVLCLSVMNPRKMQLGLRALEDVNVYVLVIRHMIENKKTTLIWLTAGMIMAYVVDFGIIHCKYFSIKRRIYTFPGFIFT